MNDIDLSIKLIQVGLNGPMEGSFMFTTFYYSSADLKVMTLARKFWVTFVEFTHKHVQFSKFN